MEAIEAAKLQIGDVVVWTVGSEKGMVGSVIKNEDHILTIEWVRHRQPTSYRYGWECQNFTATC